MRRETGRPTRDLDDSTGPRLAVGLALGLLSALVASCGGNSHPGAASATVGAPTDVVAVSTTTTTSPPLPLPHLAAVLLSADGGYTARVELDRGNLMPAGQLTEGADTLGTGCQIDKAGAAVVPFRLTITNTTRSFADAPVLGLTLYYGNGGDEDNTGVDLSIESTSIGSGSTGSAQCTRLDSNGVDFPDNASNPIGPGQAYAWDGFFIANGYFSPAYPNGNLASLVPELLRLQPGLSYASDSVTVFSIDSSTGTLNFHADGMAYAAFDPASNGGCTVQNNCASDLNLGGVG